MRSLTTSSCSAGRSVCVCVQYAKAKDAIRAGEFGKGVETVEYFRG